MAEHILEIVAMLIVSAILGFLIAWFWIHNKISTLQVYIDSLEDNINRLKTKYSKNETKLIDCQTNFKKREADLQSIEKLLVECQAKLIVSDVNLIKKEIDCEDDEKEDVPLKKLSKQDEALERIKAKSEKINFSRIGFSNEDTKDDLKLIKGIGPFIEKKLNALGLFTFNQISNFNDEDKDIVNDAIEFFPGRIKRDDWVGQAKDFIK